MNPDEPAEPCPAAHSTLFDLGEIQISSHIEASASRDEVQIFLQAYAAGDWGISHPEMAAANDKAIRAGGQVHAFYRKVDGQLIFISTVRGEHSLTSVIEIPSDPEKGRSSCLRCRKGCRFASHGARRQDERTVLPPGPAPISVRP